MTVWGSTVLLFVFRLPEKIITVIARLRSSRGNLFVAVRAWCVLRSRKIATLALLARNDGLGFGLRCRVGFQPTICPDRGNIIRFRLPEIVVIFNALRH